MSRAHVDDFPADFEIPGSTVGTLTHRLVAATLEKWGTGATVENLLASSTRLKVQRAPVYRQSLVTSASTLAATYFRAFKPEKSKFLGAEIFVGSRPVDLLWESRSGQFWIDEIKSGLAKGFSARAGARSQANHHYENGLNEFGDRFAGVRVVLLRSPRNSYWVPVRPDDLEAVNG